MARLGSMGLYGPSGLYGALWPVWALWGFMARLGCMGLYGAVWALWGFMARLGCMGLYGAVWGFMARLGCMGLYGPSGLYGALWPIWAVWGFIAPSEVLQFRRSGADSTSPFSHPAGRHQGRALGLAEEGSLHHRLWSLPPCCVWEFHHMVKVLVRSQGRNIKMELHDITF